jgi:hypothetical protein
VLETRAQDFLQAIESGKISTNIYLRRIHNFALSMNWLPVPVIPRRMWPGFIFKDKRAITFEEHKAIVAREPNPERKAFYQMACIWELRNPTWRFLKMKTSIGRIKSSITPGKKAANPPSCGSGPRSKKFFAVCPPRVLCFRIWEPCAPVIERQNSSNAASGLAFKV